MTIVRIVLADPRTGRPPRGGGVNGQLLIVLADDTGHRAVPLWLPGLEFKLLWRLLDPPARDAVMDGVLEETITARVLHAAGVAVIAVDIEPGRRGCTGAALGHGRGAGRAGHGRRNPARDGERRVRPETGGRGRDAGPGGRRGDGPAGGPGPG